MRRRLTRDVPEGSGNGGLLGMFQMGRGSIIEFRCSIGERGRQLEVFPTGVSDHSPVEENLILRRSLRIESRPFQDGHFRAETGHRSRQF